LTPVYQSSTIDVCGIRRAILQALQGQLPLLEGTLLDVGCGHMPYRPLLVKLPSRVKTYIGMDLPNNGYREPDLLWDGKRIPLEDSSVDCALATEVFEHCPEPEKVMREICRVLRPGGRLFATVPFLWPLHCVPHDEYRFTPFSMRRHLQNAGFEGIEVSALGGWHASLAQMIGLWARRSRLGAWKSLILSTMALPLVWFLNSRDEAPSDIQESCMLTGLAVAARKPLPPQRLGGEEVASYATE
jgi:SAM-dependent methyltransferase